VLYCIPQLWTCEQFLELTVDLGLGFVSFCIIVWVNLVVLALVCVCARFGLRFVRIGPFDS